MAQGINLSELATAKGLRPRMGLQEAKEEAEGALAKITCTLCRTVYTDTFPKTMILIYGQCPVCLRTLAG